MPGRFTADSACPGDCVLGLSDSALSLQITNGRRVMGVDDVRTIRQRRSDPLANGTLLGLAIGGGLSSRARGVAAILRQA
jgi:hypothetical protein